MFAVSALEVERWITFSLVNEGKPMKAQDRALSVRRIRDVIGKLATEARWLHRAAVHTYDPCVTGVLPVTRSVALPSAPRPMRHWEEPSNAFDRC